MYRIFMSKLSGDIGGMSIFNKKYWASGGNTVQKESKPFKVQLLVYPMIGLINLVPG